jgi:hypothetical protein
MSLSRSERGARGAARASPEWPPVKIVIALAVPILVLGGCASLRYSRLDPPQGASALGLEFGADRAATESRLRAAGVAVRPAQGDPDVLVADRCPGAPVRGPCRLLFGPRGLYAAELTAPAADAEALADAVGDGMGRPDRVSDAQAVPESQPVIVAGWDRPGWTVTVTRGGAATGQSVCRIEYDVASPPVVAGVPLGRLREDVEHALEAQGATVVQRDAGATTYLGCPQGASDAVSCVILFRGGRAAAVTEVQPRASDDPAALSLWRILAKKYERDIGRAPETSCPQYGPDRVAGDCTATWASDRLVVVVGAHRAAGSKHRGAISVYTAFTYPPLASAGDAEEAETQADAQ